jgi:RimJ/RimL family protein N-acetyltransferase
MSEAFETTVAPDMPQVRDWLARLRLQKGLDDARQALHMLRLRHPGHAGVQELLDWHDPQWWQPLEFGGIRLERRTPEHFEFVWSVVLNKAFAAKLKHIPEHLTARDLLHILTQDHTALLPDSRSIQWVVFKGNQPIGLAMFVNINFRNRTAEQIMGLLPGHDISVLVGDVYCATLMFAFHCLGLNKAVGLIYGSNQEVAEQQERLGFEREGLLRQAVWNDAQQSYEDLLQIALTREKFEHNRVLQGIRRRRPHDALFERQREWPRYPLSSGPG